MQYDSGDFPARVRARGRDRRREGLQAAQARVEEARQAARPRASAAIWKSPRRRTRKWAASASRPNGDVTIITGTLDYGQGHAAPFAQVLAEKLGVPFERIRLLQGDSDELLAGGGTGGSRSMYASGAAIVEGADEVIEKGKQIAGFVLEASAGDIEFARGRFTIAGTDRSIGIMELAEKLRGGLKLPEGVPNSLERQARHRGADPVGLPERLPRRRGRDRSRHRRDRGRELQLGQRLRHHHQSAAGRGPGAWRRRAGHRPGADGARPPTTPTASC